MGDLVKKYMDGELKVDEFITHRKSLGGVNEAFAVMKVRLPQLKKRCALIVTSLVIVSDVSSICGLCRELWRQMQPEIRVANVSQNRESKMKPRSSRPLLIPGFETECHIHNSWTSAVI
jgi:hypothetical protein